MNEEKIIEILLNMQIDMNARFDKLESDMNNRFDRVDARFNNLESEVKAIHEQTQDLFELETETRLNLDKISKKLNEIQNATMVNSYDIAVLNGSYKHAGAIGNLFLILGTYLRGKSCRPFTSELDIHFDTDNTYRPDISVICDFSKMKEDGYHGAPALIVEVLSPSTASRDRGDKFDNYEKYGVQEYLLINPEYLTVEQYLLIEGQLKLQAIHFRRGTTFKSGVFEDLVYSLNDIFEYRQE